MSSNEVATFSGYASALPTPFKANGIDEEAFAAFCDWQIREGIAALVVNGTTGEAPTLSEEEQSRLIRLALEVANGRVPVIAGVGSNATEHAVELAKRAQSAGADGLLAVTPYYNKPPQEGLFRHFSAIHDATERPILLYDVPSRTGCRLALETLCRLSELPRITGIKDASGDLSRPGPWRRLFGDRFRLLSGDDATALDYLGLGGNGCISVVSNVAPALCNRLFAAVALGDDIEACLIERWLRPLTAALFLESNPVPLKWALGLMRRMTPALRLPLCEPAETTRTAVRAALAELGLVGPNLLVPNGARAQTGTPRPAARLRRASGK